KVLEAMAMEKPVVATNAASRALSVQPGNHLWVEDDPVAFAHAVREAVSGAVRAEVARNGRRYVELAHDWSRNLADLDVLLERATGAGSGHILEPEPRVTIDHASISPRTGVMAGGI
ncbi:MAG: glycosyltransferase, partial [Alphaproteobacteria bacterium]|nr:glycosyltransferase [Alphaproteobacteria bacterium]